MNFVKVTITVTHSLSSAGIALDYGLDDPSSISARDKKLLSTVQAGSGAEQSVKLTTNVYLVQRSSMTELHRSSPMNFHGVVRNYLTRATSIPTAANGKASPITGCGGPSRSLPYCLYIRLTDDDA